MNLKTKNEARESIIKGFLTVADAVSGTLGSAGYNGIIEGQLYPYTSTTNDGVSIAKSIYLDDPFEMMGANLAKEIAEASDKQSRDGTTTSLTIAAALLRAGIKSDIKPITLKRNLEKIVPEIESKIDAQKKDIEIKDIAKVATISAEDESIGSMIQEIYEKIGKNGIIFRDISKSFNDHYEIGKGIQIEETGFASPYMADMDDKTGQFLTVARLKNPKVLITKQKIGNGSEIEKIAPFLASEGISGLVIFADDFDAHAITSFVMTRMQKNFRIVLIKMPVLWRDQWFIDLAKMTNATIIDPQAGLAFKDISLKHLGSCENIEIYKDQVFLDGIQDISEHIAILEQGEDDDKIRAARLAKKTARVFVGAPTEQALSYRRLKWEDAVGTAWQALHGGIVAGGGVALHNIAKDMNDDIIKAGLEAPIIKIIENAGENPNEYLPKLSGNIGYDTNAGNVKDMMEANIIDAANVTKNSTRSAFSVVAQILSIGVATYIPRKTKLADDQQAVF